MPVTQLNSAGRMATPERLRSMVAPCGVAIVGASESSSWARNLVHSLEPTGGTTSITMVNPRGAAFGRPLLGSLAEVSALTDPRDDGREHRR